MATFSEYEQGQFCWVDLMAHDMESAKEFYKALLGWGAEAQDTQGGPPYTTMTLDGHQVAGIGEMTGDMKEQGMPPVWNSYISVDDVDAMAEKTKASGGQCIMPPMDVVDAGRMAIIQDPSGAFVSLWQKKGHCGATLVNVPGTWVWNELLTRDIGAAQSFFSEMFDWKFEKEENSPNDYWMIKLDERMVGGAMTMPEGMEQVPPHWSVYFHVIDIDASLAKLQELGGQVYRPPFDTSVGQIAVVADNQGATFDLIHMTVPPDE